ncbi:YtxH domain-containing protein [Hymenobacter sp. BT491]|uniref:YtxH domain-containing protein n=1 Tax=Hymenobacter sp. BT491 TaxID=2766779 RepID=UPI001653780F|nr:YtxH domain-containing protein [Hymenobacter sp. BT491]MBC6991377.1 YtxH domain-containing protein [Hymenobacter sp. BT491]
MKKVLFLAIAAAAFSFTSCDSKKENAQENAADQVENAGEAKADSLEDKADAVRDSADATSDKMEDAADANPSVATPQPANGATTK